MTGREVKGAMDRKVRRVPGLRVCSCVPAQPTSAGKYSTAFPDTSSTVREQHPLMVYRDGRGRGAGESGVWMRCSRCTFGSRFNLFFAKNSFLSFPSWPTEEGNLTDREQCREATPSHHHSNHCRAPSEEHTS